MCTDTYKEGQGAAVWQSIYSNGGTFTGGYSDFSFPKNSDILHNHETFLKYLQDYAEHFKLLPHIRLSTRVIKVDKAPDYDNTGCWKVTYKTGGNQEETDTFDYVIVASGYFRIPVYPDIDGMKAFRGEKMHSLHYRSTKQFEGKTVVVIGTFA